MKFTNFKITKLWGTNSYNIDIKDNKLIFVAENGAGKTIILKLIYLFLSKQWSKLKEYKFESISATINKKNYKVNRKQLKINISQKDINELIININPSHKDFFKKNFINILKENDYNLNILLEPLTIKTIAENYNTNDNLLIEIIKKTKKLVYKDLDKLINLPELPVMYLPTYRRIEKSFNEVVDSFRNFETEDDRNDSYDAFNEIPKVWNEVEKLNWKQTDNNYIEIIEFGINDIKYKFDNSYYSEEKINMFIATTENYLVNKSLIYKHKKLQVKINETLFDINTENILSSGEKHIISLFFYLILTDKQYFIIFDEPEISISTRWQEKMLESILETKPLALIIATHSHSIVLEEYFDYLTSIYEIKINQ